MTHYFHPETGAQLKGPIRGGPSRTIICLPCSAARKAREIKEAKREGRRVRAIRPVATRDIAAHDRHVHPRTDS